MAQVAKKKREIHCDNPSDIQNKSVERYFGKLIKSGYIDPKKDLLAQLLKNAELRKKIMDSSRVKKGDQSPPQSIVQDIQKHF